ncbi:MAG: ABC transporter permease [Acidobacteria bacterium]|nr:ABC transporter permease [Acidobacteriota bacterium]
MDTFKDVLRQLLRDVRSQKLRTFLTVFGIVWGTVAVTLLLAFGTGLKKQLIKKTAGLGDRIVIAWPGLTSMPWEGLGKGRRIRLNEDDIEALRKETPNLKAISSEYQTSMKLNYGTKTIAIDVSGVSPEFCDMRNLIPAEGGRFLNPLDMDRQRRVLFLGNEMAKSVFGTENAVGKTVLLGGSPFLIIGTLEPKEQDSSYSGRDNEKGFIPGTTFRALTGRKWLNNIVFQSQTALLNEQVSDSILKGLAHRRKFSPEDKEALSLWDTNEQFAFFEVFMLAFTGFLGIMGCLTLVVGGIGVSNIMNVVVEERTKEIGVKMALGAKARYVLSGILLETLCVTAIGGLIGFAVSLGICAVFPQFGLTEFVGEPKVSPAVAAITIGILGVIGLIAGWFPAREAASLDPVVAMKL